MKYRLLERITEEMQVGVIAIGPQGEVLYTNPCFERFYSTKKAEEGSTLKEIVEDGTLIDAVERVLLAGGPYSLEVAMRSKVQEVRLVPFMEGELSGVIGFFRDVTEEKSVEAIKRDFVSNVSHELRTPLASIKGYAETLLDGAMEEKETLRDFLSIIDKHAARMTALIDDLLTLSKLESHLPLSFEEVEVGALVQGVIKGFERNAESKGLRLIADIESGLFPVRADRVRMEQVIVNLVDNAIKYTNQGEIKIKVSQGNGWLKVGVEDTGIGIPEDDIHRIFERFYRVDKGRSRMLGGTGLGLAIVKHIIHGHDGRISVESTPGMGTTFTFLIPARRPV